MDDANGRSGHLLAKQVVVHGIWGFIVGYVVLHPISMLIFHWLDPRLSTSDHSMHGITFPSPLIHSFTFQIVPMAIVFGLIGEASFHGSRTTSSRSEALKIVCGVDPFTAVMHHNKSG
jgi:hypothetical protein